MLSNCFQRFGITLGEANHICKGNKLFKDIYYIMKTIPILGILL